jgi:hypothetical protein
MVNVTINMTMEDFEYIKDSLQKAYLNTCTDKHMEIDRENIEMANAHISHVLSKLGL